MPDGMETRAIVAALDLTVGYSLQAAGNALPRRARWLGERGRDF